MDRERRNEESRPLLDRVLAGFLEDSRRYRDLEIPEDEEDKRQLLRSLMNIRMPRPMDPELLALQDNGLPEGFGGRIEGVQFAHEVSLRGRRAG